jgi:thiamine biosynthesis protein ThiS
MTIVLNGQSTESGGARTVAELIQRYDLHAATILIEHNGVALHRREWTQGELRDGDRIEIVQVVAGG